MELLTYKDGLREYTYYLNEDRREIRHGLYRFWYGNGQLEYEHNYKDGKKHGLYKEWYCDGKLKRESRSYYWEGIECESKEAYEETLIVNKVW